MDRIRNWIEGEDFTGTWLRAAKRPRLITLSDSPVEIHIHGPLGSSIRRVLPSLSTADLYQLAFRSMRGLHQHFDLHHNNQLLGASEDTIQSQNINDGAMIQITGHENLPTVLAGSEEKPSTEADFEDLCLIKVYDFKKTPCCSYWVPTTTTNSLASIIFRYWRYNRESGRLFRLIDMDVWTGLVDNGDGHLAGSRQDHWRLLATLLNPFWAKGSLEEETIYAAKTNITRGSTTARSQSDDEFTRKEPLVLKVKVSYHKSKQDEEQRAKRERDSLSRVGDLFILLE